jgi:CRP-like cAMP-binding protein
MDSGNHLITLLARRDRANLLELCQSAELQSSQVLGVAGSAQHYVWFPQAAAISLFAKIDHHPAVEVALVGREGMLGAYLALGMAVMPLLAVVQGAGDSLCITARAFSMELARSASLQKVMFRYLYVQMAQLAAFVPCLGFHQIAPRMARWLLMMQDRMQTDQVVCTHEALAYRLGVRREGITIAALSLQRDGLIDYRRGFITIANRPGLIAIACPCYAADRAIYAQYLG